MPTKTSKHYTYRFKKFIYGWKQRGYATIPEEAPPILESKCWAPSWRRMCKCLLRNDYWCKGLGFSQHKSDAYSAYQKLMQKRRGAWGMEGATVGYVQQPHLFNEELS